MKRGSIAVAAVAIAVASCRDGTRTGTISTDRAAETYVHLVLALGERDSDSLDTYRGPVAWQNDARARHADLEAIRAEADALIGSLIGNSRPPLPHELTSDDDAARRLFLIRQLHAIAARVDILRGSRPPFAEETRRLFDLDVAIPPSDTSANIRAEIDRLLPGGELLPVRYATFDRRFLIAPDRLDAVLTRAIAGCRAATAPHVTLPAGERVELTFARDMPWSAYTKYVGGFVSRITVNAGLPLTVDRALDLACHEGYPGHHLIHTLLEQRFASTRVELLAQPLFSPQSMLHEAAASVAPALAFPDGARLAFERDELFPLANLDRGEAERYVRVSRLVDRLHVEEARIAASYLDGVLDFPRASAALERDALMPSADATLKFINQFRSYAATYTAGRDAFAARVGLSWPEYLRRVTAPEQTIPP